jgi:endonuclease YncB( thermonuclease family)
MKRTLLLSLVLALAFVSPTFAADLNVQVLRVVDGDTIRVCLLEPAPEILRVNLVRLRGCDAPELHDQRPELRAKAEQARAWIAGRVHVGDALTLEDVQRDKYGRFLATIRVNGQDLAQSLIAAGLAKAYDGGRRSW